MVLSSTILVGTLVLKPTEKIQAVQAPKGDKEIVAGGYEIDTSDLPEVRFTKHPEWEELFREAWNTHKRNIRKASDKLNPNKDSYYIDEAYNDYIYAWDTAFMLLFNKYGNHQFPTLESLDNFYYHQVDSNGNDDGYICREISEKTGEFASWNKEYDNPKSVNPPLWAWAEWEQYQVHGDANRFEKMINNKTVLERLISHFNFIERTRKMDNGLYGKTSGLANGLDNTPNQDHGDKTQTYNDLSIQQAQSAYYIAKIAGAIGDRATQEQFEKKYNDITEKINQLLWSKEGNFYFNLDKNGKFTNIPTPTGLWAMAANVATAERAKAMIDNYALNSEKMFRPNGLATTTYDYAINDNNRFWPLGNYWEGGVWAPTSYQYLKGLQNYGYDTVAFQEAIRHVNTLLDVYKAGKTDEKLGISTFWENYSSEYTSCGQRQFDKEYARSYFVGWTGALAIASMIEDVIGVTLNAPENVVQWNIHLTEGHGINKLYMKHKGVVNRISLFTAERKSAASPIDITVTATKDFTLQVRNNDIKKTINVKAGTHTYHVNGKDGEEPVLAVAAHSFNADEKTLTKEALDQNAMDYVVFDEKENVQIHDGLKNRIQKNHIIYNVNTIGYRADSSQNPMKVVDNPEMEALGFQNAKGIVKNGYQEGEEGFMIMAPASNKMQTLNVLVGVRNAKATITGRLSDDSIKGQSQVLYGNDTEQVYLVEIPYRAASDDKYVMVKYVIDRRDVNGYIVLKGAFLSAGGEKLPQELTNVTVESGNGELIVDATAHEEEANDSYRIYVGKDKASLNRVCEATKLPYSIQDLENYTTYYVAIAGVKNGKEGVRSVIVSGIPEEVKRTDRERAIADLEAAMKTILNGNTRFDALKQKLNFVITGSIYGSAFTFESSTDGRMYGLMNDGTLKRPVLPLKDVYGKLIISCTYKGETVKVTKDIIVKAAAKEELCFVEGSVQDFSGQTLNLTLEGTKDWKQYCDSNVTNYAHKKGADYIAGLKRLGDGGVDAASDSPIYFKATDAADSAPVNQRVITHRNKEKAGFEFSLPYSSKPQSASVYALAYDSVVQLEFIINGETLYKDTVSRKDGSAIGKFTVQYKTLRKDDDIKVRLTMIQDYGTHSWGGSVGLAAVTLKETKPKNQAPKADSFDETLNIQYNSAIPASLDLTDAGTKDWLLFSSTEDKQPAYYQKNGGNSIHHFTLFYGDNEYKCEHIPNNTEYKTVYSFTDGAPVKEMKDQKPSLIVKGNDNYASFTLPGGKNMHQVNIYTGAWSSKVVLEVNTKGKKASAYVEVGGSVQYGVFTLNYQSDEDIQVKLYNVTSNDWGNFSISAITVKEFYSVDVSSEIKGGSVELGLTSAYPGQMIDVYARPDNGMKLKKDSLCYRIGGGEAVAITDGRFVMPAGNVVVTAEFEKAGN